MVENAQLQRNLKKKTGKKNKKKKPLNNSIIIESVVLLHRECYGMIEKPFDPIFKNFFILFLVL